MADMLITISCPVTIPGVGDFATGKEAEKALMAGDFEEVKEIVVHTPDGDKTGVLEWYYTDGGAGEYSEDAGASWWEVHWD